MTERIVFVTWICERDYPLLPLHLQALRRVSDAPVFYVWDGKDKTPPPKIRGKSVHLVCSDFDRRGNLNGQECVENMVAFYARLVKGGAERVVKIDIDTIITSLDWCNMADGIGFHTSNGYYWTGCCYSINKTVIERLSAFLSSTNIERGQGYHLPEDQVMTMLSALCGCSVKILENEDFRCVGFASALRNHPRIVQSIRGVIHLGQWQRVEALMKCGLQRIDIVKADMAYCLGCFHHARLLPSWNEIPEHSAIAKREDA